MFFAPQNNFRGLCTTQTRTGQQYGPQATEIVRGLYISDLHTAYDVPTLNTLRISHIVSVMSGQLDLPPYPKSQLLQIPVEDMPFVEILCYLESAVKWIERALRSHPEAKVLVHCFKGASRSATIVCAYLMKTKRWSLNDSLAYIRSRRLIAEPNFGFMMQLQEYEKSL